MGVVKIFQLISQSLNSTNGGWRIVIFSLAFNKTDTPKFLKEIVSFMLFSSVFLLTEFVLNKVWFKTLESNH